MPTKLYFRSTTNALSGLPTTEQSTLTADHTADSLSTNRTLSTIKGSSALLEILTPATTSQQEYYFSRFVSEPLNMSSISSSFWTYRFGTWQGTTDVNFPVSGTNKPVRVNCYVWRPSTSTKVGTILDGNTISTIDEDGAASVTGHIATFSGAAVSGMQNGDVLIFEVWFIVAKSSTSQQWIAWYYDGSNDTFSENEVIVPASVGSNIEIIEQDLVFSSATSVGNDCIQKYDIRNNISQTSVHKYGLSVARSDSVQKYKIIPEFEGFTFFCRLFIPFLRNEIIYNKRAVLFSKLDDEQITFGYVAQVSDAGDIYFIVRHNNREYTLTALDAIEIPTTGLPDFLPEDFNSVDYFTIASTGVLPELIPYDDLAFTYDQLSHRMQIIKNGTIIADTNDNPEATGLVGHWKLVEGGDIGDDPDNPQTFTRTAFNSVDIVGVNDGIITNALWDTTTYPHETYLSFNGTDSRVEINNYNQIAGPTSVTVSLWYYHKDLPNSTNYFIRKNPPGAANNWSMYSDGSFVRMRIRNQDNTIYDATFNNAFPDTNTWYHIVGKWTMGQAVNIFVNNSKITGTTTTGTLSGTGTLRIGNFTDNTVDGLIHDVKVWNRELSDSEVTTLYDESHPHAGFPAWQANPPPPPEIPEPITNPFVEIYDLAKPDTNFTWQKLHKLVVSGFTQVYTIADGTTIPPVSVPFSTIYEFTNIGGGGGGGAEETVYDVSASSSSHIELNSDESLAAGAKLNSSSLAGKVVTRIQPRGRRFGDPSGTVYGRIWSSNGSLKATINSYSVGNWSTSDGNQPEFVNTGNTITLAVGDIVGIEFAGGDDTEGIELQQNDSDVDGNWSPTNYEDGWGNSDINSNDEVAMKIVAGTSAASGELPLKGDDSHLGAGIYAASGGVLVNKTITRATFLLKRTGSPGGTVTARVYNSAGSSTVIGSINANDVATTATNYTFTNLANTRVLTAGSWVGVTVSSISTGNYISTHNGPGASNGGQEVRFTDTFLPPFSGTNYQWQVQSTTDCAGKLEIGGTTTPEKLHYYNLDGGAIRAAGQVILNTSSPLYNKKITRVKPKLKAVGNPTGTIFCRIRNSSGSFVSACGSIEADSVSPNDFTSYEFTNLLQGRTLANGDKIMIEYTGTATDYIQIMVKHGGAGPDDVQTFNGSSYTQVDADISGQIFTGGTASDPTSRERVGEKAEGANSILKLKKLSKALIWLRKVGAPPNDVTMRIRRQSDDNTMAVIGTVPTSSITTAAEGDQHEFTKSPVSIYAIQENDSVLVEYTDGDDDNYVEVAVTTTNQIDDLNSLLVLYDALFTDYDVEPNQDLIMTAHEGGDTFTPTGDEIPPPPAPAYTHDLHIFAGGYPYDYYIDQDNTTIENWMSVIAPDIRFYRKILTTTELTNIFVNRRDRSTRPKGQICVIGFFSLPPFS